MQVNAGDPEVADARAPLNYRLRDTSCAISIAWRCLGLLRRKSTSHPPRRAHAGAAHHARRALTSRVRGSARRGCRTAVRSAAAPCARSKQRGIPTRSRPSRRSSAFRRYPSERAHPRSSAQIGLGQRERFADPQPDAPQKGDQRTGPVRVGTRSGLSHHEDGLLNRRWVRGAASSFVRQRASGGMARGRCWGSQPAGDVHQSWLGHDVLSNEWARPIAAPGAGRLHDRSASHPGVRSS